MRWISAAANNQLGELLGTERIVFAFGGIAAIATKRACRTNVRVRAHSKLMMADLCTRPKLTVDRVDRVAINLIAHLTVGMKTAIM